MVPRPLKEHLNQPGWFVPLALLGAVLLCYGLWIPRLGLYGNDLPYLYYYHLLGSWGPGAFASIDRPASALFYAAATGLLGESVWPYHVLLLLLRWLSGMLLVWVLRLAWPERTREALLAALLFVVYPGFRQNPIAVEFILHFAVLDLFLLSLGASLKLACEPTLNSRSSLGWLALTAVGAASVFWAEYFIGLEALRPILLWIVTRRMGLTGRAQWNRIGRAWLPALIVVGAFVVWRVFIFAFPTYEPVLLEQLAANPPAALLELVKNIARDLSVVLLQAWRQTLALPAERGLLPVYAALVLAGFLLALAALLAANRSRPGLREGAVAGSGVDGTGGYWAEGLLGIGLVALLAGGLPFWVTGIPVTVEFPWDRSTLAFMLGASLVGVGLLEMAAAPRYRPVLAAGLVGLAVGMHFLNALAYEQEWRKLQSFLWQMTWRAPGLEPGTLILFDVIPLNRYSDNDLTALLNWTYAPEHGTRQIPYKAFDLTIRLGEEHAGLPGLEPGLAVEHNHRGLLFKTTTSQALALDFDPPGCLKLLGSADAVLPGLPERLAGALAISHPDRIRVEGAARPPAVLGEEPGRDWCYYYQKAALAAQQERWDEAAGLGEQARAAGLEPADRAELLPFIEGSARAGRWEQARRWNSLAAGQADLQPALCALWQEIESTIDTAGQSEAAALQSGLGCRP